MLVQWQEGYHRLLFQPVLLDLGVQQPPIDPELVRRLGPVPTGAVERLLDQLTLEGGDLRLERAVAVGMLGLLGVSIGGVRIGFVGVELAASLLERFGVMVELGASLRQA